MSTISTTPVPSSTNTTVASTSSTISLIPSASSIEAATITKSKQSATTESTTPVITSTSTQFQTSTSTPATESTASTQTTSPKSSSSGATEQTTTSSTTTEVSTVITEATTTTQTTLPTSSSSRSTVTKSSGEAEPCIKDEASEHCYQIVDTNVTWMEALNKCRRDGGDLIIIESFEEQQFIAAQILNRTFAALGLWMGSENAGPKKQPTWINGEKFSYTNWAEGEPNNPWVDEDCVEINIGTKAWNDYTCTYLQGFICEYTPTYGINMEHNCNRLCLKGEAELCIKDETTGHCYKIVDRETAWTNAFRICQEANGMLVVIESAQEQQFIEHQMQKINFTVHALWMGSNTLHPEAQRKWTNGKEFNYVNWEEGQPDNSPYVETCAEIYTEDGMWSNYECTHERGYICEKTLTTSSDGAKQCIKDETSGHCYQIVDTLVTWTHAFNICREDGGNLVIIESAQEQQFIAGQMWKKSFTADALWIGSNKVHPEKERKWLNGADFSYVNWDKGEPDNPPRDENCAEIYTNPTTWNDQVCTDGNGYICEYTKNLTRYGKEPYIKDVNSGNHYMIEIELATWTQASDICRKDDGMLLIIESAEEQQFIGEQIQKRKLSDYVNTLWMGSNKLHPENKRKWSNGKKFTYVNWGDGEPNNTSYVENCAEMDTYYNMWKSAVCTDLRGYICEKTPAGKTNTSQPQVFVIGVAAGTALVLLVGIILLYCIIQKRKKDKEKRDEAYAEGHTIRMNNIEHVYNQVVDPRETYCTIDDLSEQNQMH